MTNIRDIRLIPCLQLLDGALVKTVAFQRPAYIGDPLNTIRIFNELEVDELCFLDIRATVKGSGPDLELLRSIADECFVPLSYGGGIRDEAGAKKIFALGFDKIIINTAALDTPELITRLADRFGSQAVVVSIDVKKSLLGGHGVYAASATRKTGKDPVAWAQEAQKRGAGELLITSVHREGSWSGFDTPLLQKITAAVSVPVIAHGGAGSPDHVHAAIRSGVQAVAAGSMFVYQKKGMGVLINFPRKRLTEGF